MSASVFPARAGMSPGLPAVDDEPASVPRASGDEPRPMKRYEREVLCSPRERG